MEPRRGLDPIAGEALPVHTQPGPGGVDRLKVISLVEFARQLEEVEDSEDGLDNLHKPLDSFRSGRSSGKPQLQL